MINAYDEIMRFVASAPSLEAIVLFDHSPTTRARVDYLEYQESHKAITKAEARELFLFRESAEKLAQLKIRAERRLHQQDTS